jgi:omega-6 fatty acid desaturase (delta-12 desaturase)
LPQTLRDNPDLRGVSRITLFQSFRCVRLVLWDESRGRLVSFRDVQMQSLARRHFWAEPASYR